MNHEYYRQVLKHMIVEMYSDKTMTAVEKLECLTALSEDLKYLRWPLEDGDTVDEDGHIIENKI